MITGLPPYSGGLPIEYSLRCSCARRYLVFTGMGRIVGDAEVRVMQRAEEIKATFINASETPFRLCPCGQVLDFLPDVSLMLM
jgi:hypothetical protein